MITLAADPAFHAPDIDYGKLSPLLIVFGVALVGVLVEAFVPREHRYLVQTVLALRRARRRLVAVDPASRPA